MWNGVAEGRSRLRWWTKLAGGDEVVTTEDGDDLTEDGDDLTKEEGMQQKECCATAAGDVV